MRTFWKTLLIVFVATYALFFLVGLSMFWWQMPSSPHPAQGRIYALNNHGHVTYMNRKEYDLQTASFWLALFLIPAISAIQHFVDPFDERKKLRPLRPPRPW